MQTPVELIEESGPAMSLPGARVFVGNARSWWSRRFPVGAWCAGRISM